MCVSIEILTSRARLSSEPFQVVSFNLPVPTSPSKYEDGLRSPTPSVRRCCPVCCSNPPNDAALLTYSCPRYQHLDSYLQKPSDKPSTSLLPVTATALNTASLPATVSDPGAPGKYPARSPATGLLAAGAVSEETTLESKQQQQRQLLPAIDFSGEREPPRQAARGGDRGGSSDGPKPPPKPSEREAVSPARRPIGGGGDGSSGDVTGKEGGESGEETTSVDGEEDFLALPTDNAECERGESGSGAAEGEVRSVPGRRAVVIGGEGLPR